MTTTRIARPAMMRAGAGHAVFVGIMIGASVLTFLRMTTVAAILPITDFAIYATVVATGAFLAGPLSFGVIEGTIKQFPRLVADGQEARMLADSRAIRRIAAVRALAMGIPLLGIGYALDVGWARLGGLAMLVAMGNAATALVASMQRASGSSTTLAAGSVLRAGVSFSAVSLAALSGSLTAVVATEIAATIVAALVSEWLFFRRGRPTASKVIARLEASHDGRLVFLAYTAVAAPFYLDRLYVTTTMGATAGGRYAVLALILLGASLLVNTIAQRAGPDAIKRIHRGDRAGAVRRMVAWVGITSAVWLGALGTFAVILVMDWLPPAFARYAIDPAQLAPLAVAGILLNTGLIEFLIVALDREKSFVRAALVFLALVAMAGAIIYLQGAGLVSLLWVLAACRLVYAGLLIRIVSSAMRSAPAAPHP